MRLDKCPESWLREQMVAYALTQDPTISETEAKEKVDEELRESGGPGHRRTLRWHQFTETVSPTVGVLSLARHWNREGAELMWSHYSNSHSGFAVGFDEEALLSWMKSVSGIPQDAKRYEAVEGMNIRPAPVEYVEDMPMVVPCEDEPSEAVYKLVTHKSTAWEYEDEIRYLMMSFDSDFSLQPLSLDDRTQCIPDHAVTEVILGVNVTVENVERMKKILRARGSTTKLFWARLKEDEYALERTELQY